MGNGKPESLCASVAGHHQALEADLARFYPGTDLLDLWRGRLTWRKLAAYVQWLPKDAALYQSMRMARPPKSAATVNGAVLVVDEPLDAMQHGYLEELLLNVLNRIEAQMWARSDEKTRGPFTPTLPPGYGLPTNAATNPDALAAYFAGLQPPTD